MIKKCFMFFFIGAIMLLIVVQWQLNRYIHRTIKIDQPLLFTLSKGTNSKKLEQQLIKAKIIDHSYLFLWSLSYSPTLRNFKAGTYQLKPGMTIEELLKLLNSGKEAQFRIQFIEGTRLKDWLVQLENAPYIKHTLTKQSEQQIALAMTIENNNAEGWLYPDTYLYTANTTDLAILQRAHQRMQISLQEVWQQRQRDLPYKTPYDLLIMASIIEKETGINSERHKVASVFINRLMAKMRLQTDPTVIYGMGDNYHGIITKKALTTFSPYNTYIIAGLPPTPIAMPSFASLQAAANPDKTNYYYFVATGNGGHQFTHNLQEHNKAVAQYRQTIAKRKTE